ECDDRVAIGGVGIERDALCEDGAIALAIRRAVDALTGRRRLGDATSDDQVQMDGEQAEDRRWDQENVRRVEARERRAADVGARDHELGEPVADQRGRAACRQRERGWGDTEAWK